MVVPLREPLINTTKTFVGNNLDIKLDENNFKQMLVVGHNCKIQIKENRGCLKIVGHGCYIRVEKGIGTVEHVGSNGKIDAPNGMLNDFHKMSKKNLPKNVEKIKVAKMNISISNANKVHIF